MKDSKPSFQKISKEMHAEINEAIKTSKPGDRFITITPKHVKEEIDKLPEESKKNIQIARKAFEEINNDVFDFASESRVRASGWTAQQAEDIAKLLKRNKIQVGQIFFYNEHQLVLTPFKTIVAAQVYITAVQDRLLELTSVSTEVEIANLKKTIQTFTSLSFFGLITLSFKRLFKKG